MVTDQQGALRLWRKHFSTLLESNDDSNKACRDVVVVVEDDGVDISQFMIASPLNCLRPYVTSW